MPAMVLIWLMFTLLLFVIEPLFLDRWLTRHATLAPAATFLWMQRLHHVWLGLSLLTIAGAVAGMQGVNLLRW